MIIVKQDILNKKEMQEYIEMFDNYKHPINDPEFIGRSCTEFLSTKRFLKGLGKTEKQIEEFLDFLFKLERYLVCECQLGGEIDLGYEKLRKSVLEKDQQLNRWINPHRLHRGILNTLKELMKKDIIETNKELEDYINSELCEQCAEEIEEIRLKKELKKRRKNERKRYR